MAKFCDKVGYGVQAETFPGSGIWDTVITEREYFGDVIRAQRRYSDGENLNPNITLTNEFRILADAYAIENFQNICYVVWNGQYWTVRTVEVQHPRLIFTLGEVYNGPRYKPSNEAPAAP